MAQPAGPEACAPVATPRSFPGAGANPLYGLRLRGQPTRKFNAEEPRTSTLRHPSPGTLVSEANGPLAPPLPVPSLRFRNTTQESLRYLNCHEGGAIYLGDALRAEPGGISGSHALCVPA